MVSVTGLLEYMVYVAQTAGYDILKSTSLIRLHLLHSACNPNIEAHFIFRLKINLRPFFMIVMNAHMVSSRNSANS